MVFIPGVAKRPSADRNIDWALSNSFVSHETEGSAVGIEVGCDGFALGADDGFVGLLVGLELGLSEGLVVGRADGCAEGTAEGCMDGCLEGVRFG